MFPAHQAPFGVAAFRSTISGQGHGRGVGPLPDEPNPGRTLGFGMDRLAALGFATRSGTAARVAGSPQGWGPSGKGNHGFDHRPCDRAFVMRGSPDLASLSFLRGQRPPRCWRKTLSYNGGRCKNEKGRERRRGWRDRMIARPCGVG